MTVPNTKDARRTISLCSKVRRAPRVSMARPLAPLCMIAATTTLLACGTTALGCSSDAADQRIAGDADGGTDNQSGNPPEGGNEAATTGGSLLDASAPSTPDSSDAQTDPSDVCSQEKLPANALKAATCLYTDVSAAVASAHAGDIVCVPPGNCAWSSGSLKITKAITLAGAGSRSTVITNAMDSGSSLIDIVPASDTALTRVTGIGFQLGALSSGRGAIVIDGRPDLSFIPRAVRVDHNALTGGGGNPGGIVTYDQAYGVIDHNTFTDVLSGVFGWGAWDQTQIWDDDYKTGGIRAGTADAMFVEDNLFEYTPAVNGKSVDASIYIQQGSIYVVRHNTFDASAVTNPNVLELMYNHHGNQGYCEGGECTTFRGQPIFESYNNTGICSANNCEFMSMRGGSSLIHDETFKSAGTPWAVVKFDEEECWQTAFFSPLRVDYPAQDQVTNSFVWNVSYNGSIIGDVTLAGDNGGCTSNFIKKDRDYFMHPPQASGGRTAFTGTRYGGSTTAPTTGDTGSMTFSSTGPNAYYPYTPYTYPHPLTTGH